MNENKINLLILMIEKSGNLAYNENWNLEKKFRKKKK